MDFYTYYLRRIESRPDQRMAIQSCKDMALSLFERGPLTWSIESGAALLTALYEADLEPGVDPLPVFEEIEQALFAEIQGVRLDIENDIQAAIRSSGCCGRPNRRNNHRKGRQ